MDNTTRKVLEAMEVIPEEPPVTAFNMDEIQSLITAVNESNLGIAWRNLLRAKLDMCQNALCYKTDRLDVKVGH